MPVFSAPPSSKILCLNDEKNRGLVVEFPHDMTLEEVSDKLNELLAEIKKALESKQVKDLPKESSKIEEISEEQFQKVIDNNEIVKNIED